MSNVFFISDLHLYHKKINDFSGIYRSGDDYIENAHNICIKWNKRIGKKDLVWVLGDVAFSQEGFDLLYEFNGRKKLVRGNHDSKLFTTQDWLKHFETVEGLVGYKGHWLSHCPLHPDELRGKPNIHGHVHSNSVRDYEFSEYDKRYINVCCEAIDETPISFDEIKSGRYWDIKKT